MTWFVDEYFDKAIRSLDLCPGVNVTIEAKYEYLNICFFLFWSEPCPNLTWYPICQIDFNDKTIFSSEGSENPAHWKDNLNAAADALARIKKIGDE